MSKNYTVEALEAYALYNKVKLVDFENEEFAGWLVPKGNSYYLLSFNPFDNVYVLKRSHIKKLYHLMTGQLIPKEVKENF